jgi:GNAT superfamily N-acetyltransferase
MITRFDSCELFKESSNFFYHHRFGWVDPETSQIVGVIGLNEDNNQTMIAGRFLVADTHTRRGIGTALLNHCKQFCKEKQCRLVLYVDRGTERTDRLVQYYLARGFVEVDQDTARGWGLIYDEEIDRLFCASELIE